MRTLPLFSSVAQTPSGEFGSDTGAAATGAGCATGAATAAGAGAGVATSTWAGAAGGTAVGAGGGGKESGNGAPGCGGGARNSRRGGAGGGLWYASQKPHPPWSRTGGVTKLTSSGDS